MSSAFEGSRVPIVALPAEDRKAETLAPWLGRYPGLGVISRDRAPEYAEAARSRSRLFREIRLQGYQHSARTVSLFLKRLNDEQPSASTVAPRRQTIARVPSARHVARLLDWRKERLPEEEKRYLQRLCDQEPTIARAYELAQELVTMARERTGHGFDAWLTRATTSEITELHQFARGLTDDRPAIESGLCQAWSNGQTEGQVNKLKLLKWQTYGRANFDLLRRRVLHAA